MQALPLDVRYALRILLKAPGFSVVALVTLALGIGATTGMFSVVDNVLLRPLPYHDSNELVQIYETDSSRGERRGPVSPYNFTDWQEQATAFQQMAAYDFESFSYRTGNAAERMSGVMVTSNFFQVLGATPAIGRDFEPGEDTPGKPRSALLSYGAWQRRFGADPAIVGRTLTMNGDAYTVIGVMSATFSPFPSPTTEIWALPAYTLAKQNRSSHYLLAIGRLRRGLSIRKAQSQMDTIAQRLAKDYPNTNASSGVQLSRLRDEIIGPTRPVLLLLLVAVVVLLLITCANLASLLIARASSRRQEIAVRMALGASRGRLAKQLLTESMLLAVCGGTLGVAIVPWVLRVIVIAFGNFIPRSQTIAVNGPVLFFSAVVTTIVAVVLGLVPSAANPSIDLYRTASHNLSGAATTRTRRPSLHRILVSLQIGLALTLMIAAGVVFKSIWLLYRVNPGFDPTNVMTFRIEAPDAQYTTDAQRFQFFQGIVDRLTILPNVQAVGAVNDLPFSGSRSSTSFKIKDVVYTGIGMFADRRAVSASYFRTLGIPLLRGREFTISDGAGAPLVVLVNESLSLRYFPDRDPVGRELIVNKKNYRIIGVIGNVKQDDLTATDSPEMNIPMGQGELPHSMFIALKSKEGTIPPDTIRRAVAEVAPDEPIHSVLTMNERVANWFAPRRFSATVLGLFTALATLLAAVGIYGVVNYFVTQRRHEFGVRMALGATRGEVLRLVLRQSIMLTALAVVGGVLVSLGVNKLLSSLLFGVGTADPFAICLAVSTLVVVALCASYIPAHRATKVEPMRALRSE